jgi:hypothetical protein
LSKRTMWWAMYLHVDSMSAPSLMRPFTKKSCRKLSVSVSRKHKDKSTSNLLSRIKSCNPITTPEVNIIEGYAHGHSYSPEALWVLLVKWVTSCARPFPIVEDEPFIQIIKMLYSQVTIVSPHTLHWCEKGIQCVQGVCHPLFWGISTLWSKNGF